MTEYLVREYGFRGNRFKVACVENYPQHPSWFSHEDESTVRDAKWNIQPGDVVFDIGAAYGSYTLTALSAGAAFVFAWSPQGEPGLPQEADFLEESLRLNGWESRCFTLRGGLYDRTGWLDTVTQDFSESVDLHIHCDVGGASSTRILGGPNVIGVDTFDKQVPETCRLTGLFRHQIGPSSAPSGTFWMKLDVEGAEVHVLRGAERLIAELRPNILVENHNFKRATLEAEVREHLLARGYREVSTTPYHAVSHSLYVPG